MGDGLASARRGIGQLGAEYAMGLDGGGSTTLYIRDCSVTGSSIFLQTIKKPTTKDCGRSVMVSTCDRLYLD